MSRPRKLNKVPMSTVALSEELIRTLHNNRPANKSINDFLNQMFIEWREWKEVIYEWKDIVPFQEQLIKTQENKIKELNEVIEVLKKDKLNIPNEIRS